jgi:hypothetical protein
VAGRTEDREAYRSFERRAARDRGVRIADQRCRARRGSGLVRVRAGSGLLAHDAQGFGTAAIGRGEVAPGQVQRHDGLQQERHRRAVRAEQEPGLGHRTLERRQRVGQAPEVAQRARMRHERLDASRVRRIAMQRLGGRQRLRRRDARRFGVAADALQARHDGGDRHPLGARRRQRRHQVRGLGERSVGLRQLAAVDRQRGTELQRHCERLGLARTRESAQPRQQLVHLQHRQVVLPPVTQQLRADEARPQRLGVVLAQLGRSPLRALPGEPLGGDVVAESHQPLGHHAHQFGARIGLQRRVWAIELLPRLPQQVQCGDGRCLPARGGLPHQAGHQPVRAPARRGGPVRAGIAQQRGDEVAHRAGALAFEVRPVRLPCGCSGAAKNTQQRHRHGRSAQPMAPHESAQHVAGAVGPCQHGPVGQVALDVLGQRLHRGVPFGRALLQRLADDHVEIAFQRTGRRAIGDAVAGPCHLLREHCLFERRRRAAQQAVGPLPGEHLEQQEPERVDVRPRVHRAPGNLLGCGVLRRHRPHALLRQRSVAGVQQLGDAEVQQLQPALVGDQQVRRLQVTVHHQMRMRVRHRTCRLQEQLEPRRQRQRVFGAPTIDRHAGHHFQRQERLPGRRHARIQQLRDVRMRQRGQHIALACQPLGQPR